MSTCTHSGLARVKSNDYLALHGDCKHECGETLKAIGLRQFGANRLRNLGWV